MLWDENYIDEEYIDENIENLKEMIENDTFYKDKCNNFMSYDELEDDYSHNQIAYAQEVFIKKAKEYLSKKYPKKYAIWCDWCVHITTVELYREIMWENKKHREEYIKLRESRDII